MAYTEFYCDAANGSNLNAGSTTSGTAAFTYASGSWVASTGVFTVASGDPAAEGVAVGAFASVYADGATVGVFVGRVTARDATTITVSLTAKSGTAPTDGTNNRTLKIGGCWKGPNAAENFPFGFVQSTLTNASSHSPRVNLKNNATYSITAAIAHANNGIIAFAGYNSTVGDTGIAIIDGGTSGASYALLTVSATDIFVLNIKAQNNGATGSATGIVFSGNRITGSRIVVTAVRGHGFNATAGGGSLSEVETYACNQSNTAGLAGINFAAYYDAHRLKSHDNNRHGIRTSISMVFADSISANNTERGFEIIAGTAGLFSCDAYNNTSDGVRVDAGAGSALLIENCNLIKNGGYGIQGTSAGVKSGFIRNCGFGSGTQINTLGNISGLPSVIEDGPVTYASNVTPWTDPANGDFRVNLAAAKAAGRGTFTEVAPGYSGTVAFPDIGAGQHLAAAGGGGTASIFSTPVIRAA